MMNLPDNDLLAKKIQGSYISCDVKGQNVLFSSKMKKNIIKINQLVAIRRTNKQLVIVLER